MLKFINAHPFTPFFESIRDDMAVVKPIEFLPGGFSMRYQDQKCLYSLSSDRIKFGINNHFKVSANLSNSSEKIFGDEVNFEFHLPSNLLVKIRNPRGFSVRLKKGESKTDDDNAIKFDNFTAIVFDNCVFLKKKYNIPNELKAMITVIYPTPVSLMVQILRNNHLFGSSVELDTSLPFYSYFWKYQKKPFFFALSYSYPSASFLKGYLAGNLTLKDNTYTTTIGIRNNLMPSIENQLERIRWISSIKYKFGLFFETGLSCDMALLSGSSDLRFNVKYSNKRALGKEKKKDASSFNLYIKNDMIGLEAEFNSPSHQSSLFSNPNIQEEVTLPSRIKSYIQYSFGRNKCAFGLDLRLTE